MYRGAGINSFFSFSFPFFSFTGAKYWDLATVTCNLYFIYTLLYYIHGSWLHLTSLHLVEILGGIFGVGMTFFLSLLCLLGIVAYRYQYCTVSTQIEEKYATTLELPLVVRRYTYSFLFGSTLGRVCGVSPSLS